MESREVKYERVVRRRKMMEGGKVGSEGPLVNTQ